MSSRSPPFVARSPTAHRRSAGRRATGDGGDAHGAVDGVDAHGAADDGAERDTAVADDPPVDRVETGPADADEAGRGAPTPEGAPVVARDAVPAAHPTETVGAVVLAAGTGSRFDDGNKLLQPVDRVPIVRRAVETVVRSAVDEVVVVVGHEAPAVRAALADAPVDVVENPDYREGQSTSLRRGVAAARDRDWSAAVFALGDMPFVRPASVDLLLRAYADGAGSVLVAAYRGRRGNPVLFDARHFDALSRVTGDAGGRAVLAAADDLALVETDDPGVTRDVDTVADYESYVG